MTRLPGFAQRVVALDVSLWFVRQSQSLRRLYRRRVHRLSVDQAVQQVQNMRLRWRAGLQRQFDGGEHGLLVVLENQGEDLDHLAVSARRLAYTQDAGRRPRDGRDPRPGSPARRASRARRRRTGAGGRRANEDTYSEPAAPLGRRKADGHASDKGATGFDFDERTAG